MNYYEEHIRKAIYGKNKQDSLKWINEKLFIIDMIDIWQEEDKMLWKTLNKVKEELEK